MYTINNTYLSLVSFHRWCLRITTRIGVPPHNLLNYRHIFPVSAHVLRSTLTRSRDKNEELRHGQNCPRSGHLPVILLSWRTSAVGTPCMPATLEVAPTTVNALRLLA